MFTYNEIMKLQEGTDLLSKKVTVTVNNVEYQISATNKLELKLKLAMAMELQQLNAIPTTPTKRNKSSKEVLIPLSNISEEALLELVCEIF